jgi:uracil-DNA glycosylase
MDDFLNRIPADWREALAPELAKPYVAKLAAFEASERAKRPVYPPFADVFAALAMTPLADTRVVLIGQDPYHGEGQAHGLAFSVQPGVPLPPSLRNIYRELTDDLGENPPPNGCLSGWAKQGVLLLNTVLTVRAGEAHSHSRQGWEKLTDAILRTVADRRRAVFILWGGPARKKRRLIGDAPVVESAHPSPLSSYRGFFGSKPFSQVNAALQAQGEAPVDWFLGEPDPGLLFPLP